METFSLTTVLGYAFLGGVILNAMPCVFPMLGIKLMSVVKKADATPTSIRLSGILYTLGVIASFVVFATIIAVLKETGKNVGWGFQLQSPAFVAGLVLLFTLMSFSFLGYLEFTIPTWFLPQSVQRQDGLLGEFLAGVMVGVVASPCTAPFMATALGFALSQSVPVMMAVFIALGFGLGAPFLLLTFFPSLAKMLPRPGHWMIVLRQVLAFPLLLTVVWLVWVFSKQVGTDGAALLLCAVVGLTFALWLHKNLRKQTWSLQAAAFACALLPCFWLVSLAIEKPSAGLQAQTGVDAGEMITKHGVKWHAFSEEKVAELREAGQTVFVDFTAAWCLTCQANAKTVFGSQTVLDTLAKSPHISLVLADWTDEDDAITEALEKHDRSGVPLYLVYKPGEEVAILPQILTPSIFLEALQ